jgi:putative Ca2+/H+ antiporter (TMEM165/GDT1 family)
MAAILAATFIGLGFWTLKPDTLEENRKPDRFGPFVTTNILPRRDGRQNPALATIALAARYQSIVLVTLGTTLGMVASDGLACSSARSSQCASR